MPAGHRVNVCFQKAWWWQVYLLLISFFKSLSGFYFPSTPSSVLRCLCKGGPSPAPHAWRCWARVCVNTFLPPNTELSRLGLRDVCGGMSVMPNEAAVALKAVFPTMYIPRQHRGPLQRS